MSENHEHPQKIRYTVYMCGWLGWPIKRVFVGTGSSLKDGELIIFREGGFTSINYARVCYVDAKQLDQEGHSHG